MTRRVLPVGNLSRDNELKLITILTALEIVANIGAIILAAVAAGCE